MKNSKTTPAPNVTSGKGAPTTKVAVKTSWKDRLSENDYQDLKSTFDLFDQDGSGTIDPVEVDKVLQELGLKSRNNIVLQMIQGIKGANRAVKFDEFVEIVCSKVGDTKSREGISRIFQIWDQNLNGFADFESFKRIARQLGETLNEEELTEMMHNAYIMNNTQSHDGFSFEEFYAILTKKK